MNQPDLKNRDVMEPLPRLDHSEEVTSQSKEEWFSHIIELRRRMLWSVGVLAIAMMVSYHFSENIFAFLIEPLRSAMEGQDTQRLIYTSLTEAFFTTIKLSFFTALFVAMPFLLIQIWLFIAPGLYAQEKSLFLPLMGMTPILFLCGAAVVYFVIIPMAWPFFLGFQTSAEQTILPIQLEARISDYLSLIITLIFAFGLCFQLPVLLMLLGRIGFVSAEGLKRKRKYAVILAFVFGAFLTPPDVISQIGLAIPVILLYEFSIIMVSLIAKSKVHSDDGDDANKS